MPDETERKKQIADLPRIFVYYLLNESESLENIASVFGNKSTLSGLN